MVVHSPFADDGRIVPQMLKSFRIQVTLPYTLEKVKNGMASKQMKSYLVNEWGKKLSITVATGPRVAGKANNMENPHTNQQAEGMINNEKIHVVDMRKHASDMGAYMWHRYNSLTGSAKYVVSEMERLDEKLDKRETLEIQKEKRKKSQ